MKKTTFAIIGTGVVGERIITQILAHPNSEIVSVFDENKTRLKEISLKYKIQAAETLEELFQSQPNWVYIGTPPVSHAYLAEQIAERGLNILSEKPLAHDTQDGVRMVKAAVKANIKTAMHFPLMYSPVIHAFKKAITTASLGDIVRIELHTYFPHWPRKWQQNLWVASREQGGFIREIFPHFFQIMYHIFGNFTISTHETTYPEDEDLCETGVTALGNTESGIPIVLNSLSGIGQEERLEFKVFGTKKVMTIRNWSELWISETDQEAVRIIPDNQPESLLDACHDLVNGKESQIVSFEEGLKVQKWIDQLLE
ncbi:Gfo/Idh/MocA family protein [Psychrobacillus vulpis]|uniref:Gfo/Idh/MocA family oxidoreductase n=1 Tax=Psychrobacillus vulpis TaxID=2325572 RepID=A0A544TTW3_9BACI|nr:Gfo/Idh/MocA family oxidoreductase [Psychrobacillus vulpis]TQR20856.1 Gfo/Idh/MocA family oxidoreductase [Psychrobacillus vulpis]